MADGKTTDDIVNSLDNGRMADILAELVKILAKLEEVKSAIEAI